MENGTGKSVVLVRVKPWQVRQALTNLENSSIVGSVATTLGPYDLLVTAEPQTSEELQEFEEYVKNQPFCDGCVVLPSVQEWQKPGNGGSTINGWVLISAKDPSVAFGQLKHFSSVQQAFRTVGQYNLVAHIGVDTPEQLLRTVLDDIHQISGIQRTETLTGFQDY